MKMPMMSRKPPSKDTADMNISFNLDVNKISAALQEVEEQIARIKRNIKVVSDKKFSDKQKSSLLRSYNGKLQQLLAIRQVITDINKKFANCPSDCVKRETCFKEQTLPADKSCYAPPIDPVYEGKRNE